MDSKEYFVDVDVNIYSEAELSNSSITPNNTDTNNTDTNNTDTNNTDTNNTDTNNTDTNNTVQFHYVSIEDYDCVIELGSDLYGEHYISILIRHTPIHFECAMDDVYSNSYAEEAINVLRDACRDGTTSYQFVGADKNTISISVGDYEIEVTNNRLNTIHQLSLGFDRILNQFNELQNKYTKIKKEHDELVKYKSNFQKLLEQIQSMS